jgi:quinol monooxygenase YgiN
VEVLVRPTRTWQAKTLFRALIRASRAVPGVVDFDILPDPERPGRYVSIEVYADQSALDRQSKLPELEAVMSAFDDLLSHPARGTKHQVNASEPWPAA